MTHTYPHGHTFAAKVSVVFLTHGGTVSCLACFWPGITHGRSRLSHKPAQWETLGAWSYLTLAVFFRLVMTGQLLEAKWGRAWRQNKSLLFSVDCSIKLTYRVFTIKIKIPSVVRQSTARRRMCLNMQKISLEQVRHFFPNNEVMTNALIRTIQGLLFFRAAAESSHG